MRFIAMAALGWALTGGAAAASPPRRPTARDFTRYYELRMPGPFRALRLPGHGSPIDLDYLLRFPNDPRLSALGLPKANETWQAVAVENHLGIRLRPILGTDGLDFRSEAGRTVFEMLTAPLPASAGFDDVVSQDEYVKWRDGTLERHFKKVDAHRNALLVLDVQGLLPEHVQETISAAKRRLGSERVLVYDGDGVPLEACATVLARG